MSIRSIAAATVAVLALAIPAHAQTVLWERPASDPNVLQTPASFMTKELRVGRGDIGINMKPSAYSAFGSLWSSWATVVGYNVGAAPSATNAMQYLTATSGVGGAAMLMNTSGIQFHTATPRSNPIVGDPFSSEKMVLSPTGRLGIAVSVPRALLTIYDAAADVSSTQIEIESRARGWGAGISFTSATETGARLEMAKITADGELGWGADLPSQRAGLRFFTTSNGTSAERVRIDGFGNVGIGVFGNAELDQKLEVNGNARFSGNVGIGSTGATEALDVTGNVRVTGNIIVMGNINAKYQDIAEWVSSDSRMDAGTVVIISPDDRNEVMPSSRPYDTSVAGVVSDQPGLLLGENDGSMSKIATTGRVKVCVDARHGAIRPGDLLVTSDLGGCAMRSTPIELGGRAMHQPGTLIGKALEPLDRGVGQVLVLLSLQ